MSEKILQLMVWPLFVLIGTTYAQAPGQSATSPEDIPSGRGISNGARGGNRSPPTAPQPAQAGFGGFGGFGEFGGFAAQLPVAPLPSLSCTDQDAKCPYWALIGECNKNPSFMRTSCEAACSDCTTPEVQLICKNNDRRCPGWIQSNQCNQIPTFMLYKCPKGCGFCQTSGNVEYPDAVTRAFDSLPAKPNPSDSCVGKPYACISRPNGPCTDDHPLCPFWASAAQNQCNLNPFWMNQWCTVSCDKC